MNLNCHNLLYILPIQTNTLNNIYLNSILFFFLLCFPFDFSIHMATRLSIRRTRWFDTKLLSILIDFVYFSSLLNYSHYHHPLPQSFFKRFVFSYNATPHHLLFNEIFFLFFVCFYSQFTIKILQMRMRIPIIINLK